jgi:uncharacterized membrane protein (DUF373 family)
MKPIFSFFQRANKKELKNILIEIFDFFINLLIIITIGFLFYFAFFKVYTLFMTPSSEHFIHNMVFMIVLVKIYRLLVSFLKHHNISIKYMVEISILGPAIEVVFAFDKHPFSTLMILGGFGIANLLIYIFYYEKLLKIDTNS